jgi:Fic family protein
MLREHALVESAVSSNRIEGVEVGPQRIGTLVFGQPLLRDRDEEEVRGYRDALTRIHDQGTMLPLTQDTIRQLHAIARGQIWDAGQYKDRDADIIERSASGEQRIRYKTVPAAETPTAMDRLLIAWHAHVQGRPVHPLVSLAAFNLDFLCIHPFRDGNGRVSRLLLVLQCYHLGCEVGRYISIERLIEQNKERYYQTLEVSSRGWHQGQHDPWPYVCFLLYLLKAAYAEFEQRIGQTRAPAGAKTAQVQTAIQAMDRPFRIAELQHQCPGVSLDLIRRVLKRLRADGKVECLGRGQSATWQRT